MALIKCPECGKEVSDNATNCPNCGYPLKQPTQSQKSNATRINGIDVDLDLLWEQTKNDKKMISEIRKNTKGNQNVITDIVRKYLTDKGIKKYESKLGTWAAVLALFTCTAPIGLILAIIDLARGNKDEKHTGSYFAIGYFALAFIVFISTRGNSNTNTETTTEATTEVTTEATTEEVTTEETTEIDVDELKANAEEVTYEDVYRNPETWKQKDLKIVVHVDKYESKFFGVLGTYYCNVNGQTLLIVDSRKAEEPTIAAGDNVIVYGLGGGMATLTESEKNILGITTDKEESKIPQINMYAAELQ